MNRPFIGMQCIYLPGKKHKKCTHVHLSDFTVPESLQIGSQLHSAYRLKPLLLCNRPVWGREMAGALQSQHNPLVLD